jgi:hypothetical protein
VIRSLIRLAGAPSVGHRFSRYPAMPATDVSGLTAVATLDSAAVAGVLRGLLPHAPRRSQLAFPPVTGLQERHPQVSDLDRICAASSITVLADMHPDIAVGLAADLSADSGDPL